MDLFYSQTVFLSVFVCILTKHTIHNKGAVLAKASYATAMPSKLLGPLHSHGMSTCNGIQFLDSYCIHEMSAKTREKELRNAFQRQTSVNRGDSEIEGSLFLLQTNKR